jgi:hypothetical protein
MHGDILILSEKIAPADLRRLVAAPFGNMVKFVADVERRVIAIGGQIHADAEHLLLDAGSEQRELWGGNYYPGFGPDECIEYTSLINIRPAQGNAGMELMDGALRARIRLIVLSLVGSGEPLENDPA